MTGKHRSATAKPKDRAPVSPRIYQLEITLQEVRPPVWRRVLVPEDITLLVLHRIVQHAPQHPTPPEYPRRARRGQGDTQGEPPP